MLPSYTTPPWWRLAELNRRSAPFLLACEIAWLRVFACSSAGWTPVILSLQVPPPRVELGLSGLRPRALPLRYGGFGGLGRI